MGIATGAHKKRTAHKKEPRPKARLDVSTHHMRRNEQKG